MTIFHLSSVFCLDLNGKSCYEILCSTYDKPKNINFLTSIMIILLNILKRKLTVFS